MPDGVYFLDCARGSDAKTALGFYKNLVPFHNENQFPDSITDLSGINHGGGFGVWELGTEQSHTFPDGVIFTWRINKDANHQDDGSVVGTASNGFENFLVFKDRTRILFNTRDGFACTTVYFATASI